MATLGNVLELNRCPHCGIAHPHLRLNDSHLSTKTFDNKNQRIWGIYVCSTCGGAVLAAARAIKGPVTEMYPAQREIDEAVPGKANEFLNQATESKHSPAGAVMLAASAVDAMLKEKNYKKGSLFDRIDKAVEDHLITEDIGQWAHEIRLDANDQRHADESAPLPNAADAQKCIDFALALAEILFVLPSKVTRGLATAKEK